MIFAYCVIIYSNLRTTNLLDSQVHHHHYSPLCLMKKPATSCLYHLGIPGANIHLLGEWKDFPVSFACLVMCCPAAVKEETCFRIESRKATSGLKVPLTLKHFEKNFLAFMKEQNALQNYFPCINESRSTWYYRLMRWKLNKSLRHKTFSSASTLLGKGHSVQNARKRFDHKLGF